MASGDFDSVGTAAAAYADGSREAINQDAPLGTDVLGFLTEELWQELSIPGSDLAPIAVRREVRGRAMVIARAFVRAREELADAESALLPSDTESGMTAAASGASTVTNASAGASVVPAPRFVVLVAVEEDAALQPLQLIQRQVDSSVGNILALAVLGVATMFACIAFVVVRTVWVMTQPLEALVEMAEHVATLPAAATAVSRSASASTAAASAGGSAVFKRAQIASAAANATGPNTSTIKRSVSINQLGRRAQTLFSRSSATAMSVGTAVPPRGNTRRSRSAARPLRGGASRPATAARIGGSKRAEAATGGALAQSRASSAAEMLAEAWSDWCVERCCCFWCCCTDADAGGAAAGAEEISGFVAEYRRMLRGVNRAAAAASIEAEQPRLNPFWTTNTLGEDGAARPIRASEGVLVVPEGHRLAGRLHNGAEGESPPASSPEGELGGAGHVASSGGDDATASGTAQARRAARGILAGRRQASAELDTGASAEAREATGGGGHAGDAGDAPDVTSESSPNAAEQRSDSDQSLGRSAAGLSGKAAAAGARVAAHESTSSSSGQSAAVGAPVAAQGSTSSSSVSAPFEYSSEASDDDVLGPDRASHHAGRAGLVRRRPDAADGVTGSAASESDVGSVGRPDVTEHAREVHRHRWGLEGGSGASLGAEARAGAGFDLAWQREMRMAGIPFGNPEPCGEFAEEGE